MCVCVFFYYNDVNLYLSVSNYSQEQLLLTLQRKKECNARAQKVVEELLDPVPQEEIDAFLSKLVYINQSHFDDIIEERAITQLCGYPLCSAQLKDIPKQQFKISTVQNKVYDITMRKHFCSNLCFKSSEYLKEQLLTTPLWMRKDDDDVLPEFKLLSLD